MASLSDIPLDVLHHFSECYVQFCALKNTHALLAVKKNLPKNIIDFVCDTFTVNEWSILLRCLKYDKSLNSISIKSRKTATTKVLAKVDTKEKAAAVEKQRHPLIYTKYIKLYLMKSLKMCLTNHPELRCLKLEGLPLEETDIHIITNGLNACASLLHLSFSKSQIGDQGINIICHVLKHKPSISSIDFGDCNVGEQGAHAIAHMIVYQNLSRHDEGWKQSLRDRVPTLDKIPGLRRVNLNQNKNFGDKGVEILINSLMDDQYIKALDLQECGVTSNIADKLIALLEKNTGIKIIDVRCNEGLSDEHLQTIMETLSKNNNGETHEFTWLDLPYAMRPVKIYSQESVQTTPISGGRTPLLRRELSLASLSSRNGCTRQPIRQRTYSFSETTKPRNIYRLFPSNQIEDSITFTAPPPSPTKLAALPRFATNQIEDSITFTVPPPPPTPMKLSALPEISEEVSAPPPPIVFPSENHRNIPMAFQQYIEPTTENLTESSSGETDSWRLQSSDECHTPVYNMKKAQSYHCKSTSILPNKSFMKNVSKSESVVNEVPLCHGPLEKNIGDNANTRHRLDNQLACLGKRSGSSVSDFPQRNANNRPTLKNQPVSFNYSSTQRTSSMPSTQKTSRTHLTNERPNLKCSEPSNRTMPQIRRPSKTAADTFCEATINKMTMDQYNKYVYERNRSGRPSSNNVPTNANKEPAKRCMKSKNMVKQWGNISRVHSSQEPGQINETYSKDVARSGYPTPTTINKSRKLQFSSDEEDASNTC